MRMRDMHFVAHDARQDAEAKRARYILWCAALAAVLSLGAGLVAGPL
jgi:hypothetical protein